MRLRYVVLLKFTEDWSNDAEISDLITGINYILTDICIENSYFKL